MTDLSLILVSVLAFLWLISTLRNKWSVSSFFSGGINAKKNKEKDSETPKG